ncbi:MAG: hypothetical protein IKM70_07260 [Firmicutes bacterium]|nr:hypothetical protein [Bacillota bacterium]
MEKDTLLVVVLAKEEDVACHYPPSHGRLQVEYAVVEGNSFALAEACRALNWHKYRYRLLAGCGAVCDKLLQVQLVSKFACSAVFMQAPQLSCYRSWGKDEYEALLAADPALTFSCGVGDIPAGDAVRDFCGPASEYGLDLRIIWNDGAETYPADHASLIEAFVAESIAITNRSTAGRAN